MTFHPRMCGFFLLTFLISSTPAHSQEMSGQASDIKAALAGISSNDPITRSLACNKALESDDPQLRSFALEACLQSEDRRVRDSAFRYIVKTQKKFIVDIEVTEKDLDMMDSKDKSLHDSPGRSKDIFNARKLVVRIDKYDQKNDTFEGDTNLSRFEGSIGAGSITFKFYNTYRSCSLVLKNYHNGYLNGHFGCGAYSFAAKAALP